jgi:hypothetical protein
MRRPTLTELEFGFVLFGWLAFFGWMVMRLWAYIFSG